MLAASVVDTATLKYPLLGTPKLDGIRCCIVNGKPVSRTFKPIQSPFIQDAVERLRIPDGFDGELFCKGLTFQEITSAVMTGRGVTAASMLLQYWVFDWYADQPYNYRVENYLNYCASHFQSTLVKPLTPSLLINEKQLLEFEQHCLEDGFEGICVRSPYSPYKCGRSTLKEGWLLKLKRFIDEEATIVGFEEEQENRNEKTKDAFGLSERSSHKDNLVAKESLGSLVVQSPRGQFKVGTGFTTSQRKQFWDTRNNLIGKVVTVKFFPIGIKDVPRHPVFKGFRQD